MVNKWSAFFCALVMLLGTLGGVAVAEEKTQQLDIRGSVVYDLEEVSIIDQVSVKSKAQGCDLYLSYSGETYQLIEHLENKNDTFLFELNRQERAQFVKLKFTNKDESAYTGEFDVEISSTPADKEEKIQDISYSWSKKQPFVTEFDITEADKDHTALTDGSMDAVCATNYTYATAILDLKKPYQISRVQVYTRSDDEYDMDGYELKYSLDGKTYFSYGFFANPNPTGTGEALATTAWGLPGKNARYLKIVMHTTGNMAISEVEVYGHTVDNKAPQAEDLPDQVDFSVQLKNYIIAYMDWSTYNTEGNGVTKFAVYAEKSDYDTVEGLTPHGVFEQGTDGYTSKFYGCYPLEPQATYFLAVTPFDKNGVERKDVKTVRITTPGALGEDPEDIFCINHYPERALTPEYKYGSYGEQNTQNILDLLSEMGTIQKNRWYSQDTDMMHRFNELGIAYLLMFDGGYQNVKTCNSGGAWILSGGNEYDLNNAVTPAQYAEQVRRVSGLARDTDSRILISEPAISSTMDSTMDWLEQVYSSTSSDGKDFASMFDVFDLHSYCKIMDGELPGMSGYGYPEVLPSKLDKLRGVMAKYGDENKPMIFSEMGWCTNPYQNYMRNVDGILQRDYIVRVYMISIAEGIREGYLYQFQDCGTRKEETEDNYGIVDWFGIPKPAYYGLYILSSQMQNTQYLAPAENVNHPYYGYEFFNETRNQYLTSLWVADDSVKTAEVSVLGGDEKLMVLGTDGSYKYIPVENGKAQITISGAPVFIYSDGGVKVNSIDSSFTMQIAQGEYTRGDEITVNIQRSKKGEGKSGTILPSLPKGWEVVSDLAFGAEDQVIPVRMRIGLDSDEGEQNIRLSVRLEDGSILPLLGNVQVKNSLEVRIAPELPDIDAWDQWQAGIYLKNCVDMPLSGTVTLSGYDGLSVKPVGDMQFTDLQPGQEQKFTIGLEGQPQKVGANLSLSIQMEGYEMDITQVLNYAACVNDGVSPVIDGEISEGEWDVMYVGPNQPTDGSQRTEADKQNIDFKAYRKWDANNFYLLFDVSDNVHFQTERGDGIWQSDSVQFSFDPGRQNGVGSTAFYEMGVGCTSTDNYITNWRWMAVNPEDVGSFPGMKSAVKRSEGRTVYEIAIPWSELIGDKTPAAGDIYGFSMVVNDNDGSGRAGILEYMGGIAVGGKNSNLFDDTLLVQK